MLLISGQSSYPHRYLLLSMAGVLELIGWPLFKGSQNRAHIYPLDPRAQELEIAKEILAEIFDVLVPEVEEMIRQRLSEC
jgi:hypothetical protein